MADITLPKQYHPDFRVKRRKPLGPVEIDWSHPATRELVAVYLFTRNGAVNLVTGLPATLHNGAKLRPHTDGPAAEFDGTDDYILHNSGGNAVLGTKNATVLSRVAYDVTNADQRLIGFTSTNLTFYASSNASGLRPSVYAGAWNTGSNGSLGGTTPYPGRYYTWGAQLRENGTKADAKIWVDGTVNSDWANIGGRNYHTATDLYIGATADLASFLDGHISFLYVWARTLTNAEMSSLSRDSYQILKPVIGSQLLHFGSSGGTTTFGSSSVVVAGQTFVPGTQDETTSFGAASVAVTGQTFSADPFISFSAAAVAATGHTFTVATGGIQNLKPTGLVANPGGWLNESSNSTDLWLSLDEDATPNASDYVYSQDSPDTTDYIEFSFSDLVGSVAFNPVGDLIVRLSAFQDGDKSMTLTPALYEGTTLLQTFSSVGLLDGGNTWTFPATQATKNAITDVSNLSVRIIPETIGAGTYINGYVYWLNMDVAFTDVVGTTQLSVSTVTHAGQAFYTNETVAFSSASVAVNGQGFSVGELSAFASATVTYAGQPFVQSETLNFANSAVDVVGQTFSVVPAGSIAFSAASVILTSGSFTGNESSTVNTDAVSVAGQNFTVAEVNAFFISSLGVTGGTFLINESTAIPIADELITSQTFAINENLTATAGAVTVTGEMFAVAESNAIVFSASSVSSTSQSFSTSESVSFGTNVVTLDGQPFTPAEVTAMAASTVGQNLQTFATNEEVTFGAATVAAVGGAFSANEANFFGPSSVVVAGETFSGAQLNHTDFATSSVAANSDTFTVDENLEWVVSDVDQTTYKFKVIDSSKVLPDSDMLAIRSATTSRVVNSATIDRSVSSSTIDRVIKSR